MPDDFPGSSIQRIDALFPVPGEYGLSITCETKTIIGNMLGFPIMQEGTARAIAKPNRAQTAVIQHFHLANGLCFRVQDTFITKSIDPHMLRFLFTQVYAHYLSIVRTNREIDTCAGGIWT